MLNCVGFSGLGSFWNAPYEPGFFWLISRSSEISRFLKEIFKKAALSFLKHDVFLDANCIGFLKILRFPFGELRWVSHNGMFFEANCVGFRKTKRFLKGEMRWVSSHVMHKNLSKSLKSRKILRWAKKTWANMEQFKNWPRPWSSETQRNYILFIFSNWFVLLYV